MLLGSSLRRVTHEPISGLCNSSLFCVRMFLLRFVLLATALVSGYGLVCDLCFGGHEPLNKGVVISSNYIPGREATCLELWEMGLNGEIDDQVCYPLQLYAQIPCGCVTFQGSEVPTSTPIPRSENPTVLSTVLGSNTLSKRGGKKTKKTKKSGKLTVADYP